MSVWKREKEIRKEKNNKKKLGRLPLLTEKAFKNLKIKTKKYIVKKRE